MTSVMNRNEDLLVNFLCYRYSPKQLLELFGNIYTC